MLRNRFHISGQTLVVSLIATTLLYVLFSVVQPIGSVLGAALLQSVNGTQTVPPYLNYQGMLRDAEGKPISGVHKLTFRIYKDVTAPLPEALWVEEHTEVTVREGQFSVLLGNTQPIPPDLFSSPDRFIGVTVAPLDEMVPRQRFASAPYAMLADHATALTAPNGSAHVVTVDSTGRVGVGVMNPQAQLQTSASATISTALQVDAGAQHLTVNNNGVYLRGDTDNPDMMLDLQSGGAAQKGEYLFGVDGQRRASVYYDKSTKKAGMVNGNTQVNLYDNGLIETFGSLGVNGIVHTTGNLWVDGDVVMGAAARKPVKIVRITHLPENVGPVFPNVSSHDYECTIGSWSTGVYDMNESVREASKVWTYVEGDWWWVGVNFASHNKHDSVSIDVLCFLKGLVEYDTTYGVREDVAN